MAASMREASVYNDSDSRSVVSSFKQILTTFPKNISRRNLKDLYRFLLEYGVDEESYEEDGVNALLAVIFNKSNTITGRYLACGCLEQISPQPDLCEPIAGGQLTLLAQCLPVVLVQLHSSHESGFQKIKEKLISYMENEKDDLKHHPNILSFFSQLSSHNNNCINFEDTKRIVSLVPSWLQKVSVQHNSSKPSSRFKKSDVTNIVAELDGTPSTEMFTALSAVENQNADQLVSVCVFSLLRSFLMQNTGSKGNQDLCLDMVSLLTDQVSSPVRSYCLRVMEQAERTVQVATDAGVQKACLIEAVNLLNILCKANPNHVPNVLPFVRTLYDRHILKKPTPQEVAVLVSAGNFLFQHGGVIMHKMADICPYLLKDLTNICYEDPWAAYELVSFILDNLQDLCYHNSALEKFFPSLFRILAWSPTSFENDFLTILPACMSSQTSVEMFHTLLDLPCLSASLLLQKSQETSTDYSNKVDPSMYQLLSDVSYQGMFSFMLRPVSGMGDTFNRIQAFHSAIEPLCKHPRVEACAKAVIPLLKCYFDVFTQFADIRLTSYLLPAILERISILYAVTDYAEHIQSVLSVAILDLIKEHPDVCIHLQEDFVSYITKEKNTSVAPEFFINLVWAIGEYTTITFSQFCTPEVVTSYYEGLECVVYEILQTGIEIQKVKLVCVAITTLAKLSTSSQDLLQRALLCLGKVGQNAMAFSPMEPPLRILINRVNELMSLLKSPNLASQVLNPSIEILSGRWHRDVTAMPFILRTVNAVAQSES